MKTRYRIAWAMIIASTFLGILDIYFYVKAGYQYEAEINSYWSLADKSSTIPKKSEYIDKYVEVLKTQGFEGKYDAIIYPTLNNSFDQNFTALLSLQTRLHEIKAMDVTSFEYNTAIQQITAQEQGEAQQMLSVFEGIWWKRNYPFLWGWIAPLIILSIVGLGILGIAIRIPWHKLDL